MNKLQYLLTKLSEEASELSQEACKSAIFGLDNFHPLYPEISQRDRMIAEWLDVMGVMQMIFDHLLEENPSFQDDLDNINVDEAIQRKMDKVNSNMNYSKTLGLVQ